MNRIEKKFKELEKSGQKAFIVYIMAGDPDLGTTSRLVIELASRGVDMIEFGIPFSDPLADGPTIQAASERALSKGAHVKSILNLTKSLRDKVSIPFVFMTYYNLVYQYGLGKFIDDSKKAGVDGIIIPDLPTEESGELIRDSKKRGFSVIFLAAPTSTNKRLRKIAHKSTGFIYYVSLTGVTGTRKKLAKDIFANVKKIKRFTKKPVCVGFGVSNPVQAKRISSFADGIIVGSAIIKIIEKNIGKRDLVKKVGRFAASIARGIKEE